MNKAILGAIKKGYHARQRKVSRQDNPYDDIRGRRGIITFARAFRNAWWQGYDLCQHDELHGDYDGWYSDRIASD